MPTPREKSPSAVTSPKINRAGESTAASQSRSQAGESVAPPNSEQTGEQKDVKHIVETADQNVSGQSAKDRPSHQEIELIAYEIYLQRGGGEGSSVEDWLQAERRLLEAFESDSGKAGKTRARGA